MSIIRTVTSAALATVISLGIVTGAYAADDVENFYKGKRVKIIIGSGSGGGVRPLCPAGRAPPWKARSRESDLSCPE